MGIVLFNGPRSGERNVSTKGAGSRAGMLLAQTLGGSCCSAEWGSAQPSGLQLGLREVRTEANPPGRSCHLILTPVNPAVTTPLPGSTRPATHGWRFSPLRMDHNGPQRPQLHWHNTDIAAVTCSKVSKTPQHPLIHNIIQLEVPAPREAPGCSHLNLTEYKPCRFCGLGIFLHCLLRIATTTTSSWNQSATITLTNKHPKKKTNQASLWGPWVVRSFHSYPFFLFLTHFLKQYFNTFMLSCCCR